MNRAARGALKKNLRRAVIEVRLGKVASPFRPADLDHTGLVEGPPRGRHGAEQFFLRTGQRLVGGASTAADLAMRYGPAIGSPVLAVAISCVGRRLVLGERTEEETEITLEHLPAHTRQVGFYSYGEISPYTPGTCDLHDQTMTLTTISEA